MTLLSAVLLYGVVASRPAASSVAIGTLYSATDTNIIYQSDGSTWNTFATAGGGGGSPLTTKGDVFGYSTADARIPVGSDAQVLTAASAQALGVAWQYPPGYTISYTQITSSVNVTSTTEATGTTIISPGAITFDGGPVICHFFGFVATPLGTSCVIDICLFEGATEITRLAAAFISSSSGNNQLEVAAPGFYRFTPSAGSHTYTITGFVSPNTTGTPKVEAGAGGTAGAPPAFVRFVKE